MSGNWATGDVPTFCPHCGRTCKTPSGMVSHIRWCLNHGVYGHYLSGCRCAECRRAAADHQARMRRQRSGRRAVYDGPRDWVLDYRAGRIA